MAEGITPPRTMVINGDTVMLVISRMKKNFRKWRPIIAYAMRFIMQIARYTNMTAAANGAPRTLNKTP